MENSANASLIDGKYSIKDLLNLEELRGIFQAFTDVTGFTIGFLDHPGMNILIATGWKDICNKFHRSCPASANNCTKSNHHLLDQLNEPGIIVVEECDNGLVDCATPIIIKGKHVASLATGQLLIKEPDIDRFKRQAKYFGFDEKKYIEALRDVMVVPIEKLKKVTSFLGKIANILSDMGYMNLMIREEANLLQKDIINRSELEESLNENKQKFESIFENATDGILIADEKTRTFLLANRTICDMLGYSSDELKKMKVDDLHPAEDVRFNINTFERMTKKELGMVKDARVKRKDGTFFYADINATEVNFSGGRYLMGFFRDTSARRRAEEEVMERLKELQRWQSITLGRENRIQELKNEVNGLLDRLGEPKRYEQYNI